MFSIVRTLILITSCILLSVTSLAQHKPSQAEPVSTPATNNSTSVPEDRKTEPLKLNDKTQDELGKLADFLTQNEAVYAKAKTDMAQAQATIAQYESFTNAYMAVYYRGLAEKLKDPTQCSPTKDRKTVECLLTTHPPAK